MVVFCWSDSKFEIQGNELSRFNIKKTPMINQIPIWNTYFN